MDNEKDVKPTEPEKTVDSDRESRESKANRAKDPSFIAATHDTDEAPPRPPAHAEQKVESTGRKADESWKEKKRPPAEQ